MLRIKKILGCKQIWIFPDLMRREELCVALKILTEDRYYVIFAEQNLIAALQTAKAKGRIRSDPVCFKRVSAAA